MSNKFEQTVKSEFFKNRLTNQMGGQIVLDFAEAILQAGLHKIFYVGFSHFDIVIAKCPYPYSYPYMRFHFSNLLLQIEYKNTMENILLKEVDKEIDTKNVLISIIINEDSTKNIIYKPVFDDYVKELIRLNI